MALLQRGHTRRKQERTTNFRSPEKNQTKQNNTKNSNLPSSALTETLGLKSLTLYPFVTRMDDDFRILSAGFIYKGDDLKST